ncbi:MAG TPA: hypothetical protein VK826_00765, partial [Bacteroidia bacterium]|nr:hypothetical protein [Bacteroidia bacterium]
MKELTIFLRGFFFCTILLVAAPLQAQLNTFEKVWYPSLYPYSVGLDIVATSDGYTLLVATSDNMFVHPQGYSLVHTDMNGVPQWSQYYCPVDDWPAGVLKRTTDGGYILAVSVFDTSGLYHDIAMIKTDSVGNLEWSRCYGGDHEDELGMVIQTLDGGYLLCTSVIDMTYQFYGMPLILTKTDNLGVVQWSYEYYDTLPTKPHWKDVTECGEGGGYLVLERNITLRIDPAGNILWAKLFNSTVFRRVFWTGDGFTLAGNVNSGPPSLMRLDTAGTQLWHKYYPTNTNALYPNIHDAVRTSDGGYALTGEGIDTNSVLYDRATLLRTDSAGNMFWHRA